MAITLLRSHIGPAIVVTGDKTLTTKEPPVVELDREMHSLTLYSQEFVVILDEETAQAVSEAWRDRNRRG